MASMTVWRTKTRTASSTRMSPTRAAPASFPVPHPLSPEPLVFDLVRGLGARKGELEANNLAVINLKDGRVDWAPEIEWAFADDYAFELELPFVDRKLEAFKFALQGTLPSPWDNFTHGWQTFAEIHLDDAATDLVLVYIFGQRFAGKWTYLAMTGANTHFAPDAKRSVEGVSALVNASLFRDVTEWLTVGLESNHEWRNDGSWASRLFPQAHLQVAPHVRLQVSVGVEFSDLGVAPLAATRIILE